MHGLQVGYSRRAGDATENAIATHDTTALGLGDAAVATLNEKLQEVPPRYTPGYISYLFQVNTIRAAREAEVDSLHKRLKATWSAVHKLAAIDTTTDNDSSTSETVVKMLSELGLESEVPEIMSIHPSYLILDA